ncbi:hypothetical protein KDW67_34425 [Burkholderia cenocepacia]|nr:hypothetical protein [Burkholderia cenocepacia]MBR8265071.1 hypothetical protein [Burkholderia cenocepacia]
MTCTQTAILVAYLAWAALMVAGIYGFGIDARAMFTQLRNKLKGSA